MTNNNTLGDIAGNLAAIEGSSTPATDRVGPVAISARYDEGAAGVADDTLTITLSEAASGATVDTSVGGATNDFVIVGGGAFAGASTATLSGNTITIVMGVGATPLTIGTSKVGIKSGAIADTLSNISPTAGSQNQVTVNANVIVNEVMYSSTQAHQYIELHNLGSTAASLSGWTLQNVSATITIPASTQISASGYYLIAYNNTSLSGVTADLTTTSLSLNPTTQSNILLKDAAGVTYDSVKASPWAAGSGTLDVSMERKSTPGDGLVGTNWYSAQVHTGLVSASALGTPRSANYFDTTAPVIASASPANNALIPTNKVTLAYSYSDNLAVNPASTQIQLQRWNGSSWLTITGTGISTSSGVTATGAWYRTNSLPYGRYQATLTISDNAGNSTSQTNIFSVDALSVSVSTGSLAIGILPVNAQALSSDVTVTVTTLGAAFSVTLGGSGTMNSGLSTIGTYNGTTGFGYDWSLSSSGATHAFSGTLGLLPATVSSNAANIDTNGNLKTYTYKVHYGSRVTNTQAAGVYHANTQIGIVPSY